MAHLRLIKQGLHHSALSPEPSPSPSSSQSSSPTAFPRQRRTLATPCASPERMQGMLRAAVDAPLPLEVEGRALPGHDDAQVCEAPPGTLRKATMPLAVSLFPAWWRRRHTRSALKQVQHESIVTGFSAANWPLQLCECVSVYTHAYKHHQMSLYVQLLLSATSCTANSLLLLRLLVDRQTDRRQLCQTYGRAFFHKCSQMLCEQSELRRPGTLQSAAAAEHVNQEG